MTRPRTRDLARFALRAANLIPTRPRRPRLVNFAAGEAAVTAGTAAAPGACAPDQLTLTVTTFNIQFGLHAGRAARELALAARFRRPDLILLQEMDPAGSAAIARDLGFHHVYAPAAVHSHHGRQFGQAILSPGPCGMPRSSTCRTPIRSTDSGASPCSRRPTWRGARCGPAACTPRPR